MSYSVPEKIRKMKPKGTMVKSLNGKYYVYNYKNIKDPETGKWKIKMGDCIGKISEELGYVPNNVMNELTTKEFGQYRLFECLSNDVYTELVETFGNEIGTEIYLVSLILLVNNFCAISNIQEYFEQSYLSSYFSSISLSTHKVRNLLKNLGQKQVEVTKFQDKLIEESSKKIAIDSHAFSSTSNENDLTSYGFKYNDLQEEQINFMVAYDVEKKQSLATRFFPGNVPDKTSVLDFFSRYSFKNCVFLIDKGFTNVDYFKILKDNKYIIPAQNNNAFLASLKIDKRKNKQMIYKTSKDKELVEYQAFSMNDGKRIICYKNINEANKLDIKLTSDLQKNPNKYKPDEVDKLKENFGKINLITTTDLTPEEVYLNYKKRWSIETLFNIYKNQLDFNKIGLQDYYEIQGLSFIFVIADLLRNRVSKVVKENSGISFNDAILQCRRIKVHKSGSSRKVENLTKGVYELLTKLKFCSVYDIRYILPKN